MEPLPTQPKTLRPRSDWRRFWFGIVISLIFLWLAMRQVDWRIVWLTAQEVSPVWLLIGVVTGSLVYGLFALRWQALLSPAVSVSVPDAFSYIMIGYLANTILPLRLGDIVRAVLLGRRHAISAMAVFGAVTVERLLDVGWVLLIALLLSFFAPLPEAVRIGAMVFAGGMLAGLGALVLLIRVPPARQQLWIQRFPFIPLSLRQKGATLTASFVGGLQVLGDMAQLWRAIWISGLAWVALGLGTMSYVHAFKLPVPWYAGWAVLVAVNLGAAIPSSPGFIGVYHYLVWLALSMWMLDKNPAISYALLTHGLNIAVIMLLGGVSLWREGWSLRNLVRPEIVQ